MRRFNVLATWVVLGLLIGVVGCGGEGPKASVSGKVTAGGQPVTNARINFAEAKTKAVATADLDSSGAYKLENALAPGSYAVFVTEASAPAKPPTPGEKPVETPKSNIPEKYKSDASSGLKAEIKAGENKDVNFSLD